MIAFILACSAISTVSLMVTVRRYFLKKYAK